MYIYMQEMCNPLGFLKWREAKKETTNQLKDMICSFL